jgi:hypothetical protein
MLKPKKLCENVVCDVHLSDMRPVVVVQGMGVMIAKRLEGFVCTVGGCIRFFGSEGYADLTKDSEFVNVRTEPCCSNHSDETQAMYIQRTLDGLRWACPACDANMAFDQRGV